eukprot:TRINITY_DN11619_c0_g3_i1.p2 TRINITY_DN11619_c0_g3~~TRINITY_DN11619_c0_g3_i1.p2  ORF type:complete len:216 (+),score=17.29 TRINITY_DN11619_c0_g3_i1:22-648(+)
MLNITQQEKEEGGQQLRYIRSNVASNLNPLSLELSDKYIENDSVREQKRKNELICTQNSISISFGMRDESIEKTSDPGLQQTELVFLGLFGRAYKLLEQGNESELSEVSQEVDQVVQLLESRHANLCNTLDGEFPELISTVWQSEASVQQAVQMLTPQMTENKRKAEDLLREAMTLQSAVKEKVGQSVLQKLLPKRYKQYERGISQRA